MRVLWSLLVLVLAACASDTAAVPEGPAPESFAEEAADTISTDIRSSLEPVSVDSQRATERVAVNPEPNPVLPPAVDHRYAVLVGINDYPGDTEDLPSGGHDVEAMREVLVGHFGYRPANILVLRDREASRGQIRQVIQTHLAQAGPDGSALFYFSGHGLQLDGNAGVDIEADDQDEALYVWADAGERSSAIVDDELGAWVGGLATDRVLVVLDACHSGTATRGPEGWIYGLAPKGVRYADVAPVLDAPTRPEVPPVSALRHTLLAAARDQEVALSGLPGDPSLFTAVLTDALRESEPNLELADLMRGVRRIVQARSRQFRSEHTPQLEGRSQTIADVFIAR